MSLLERVERSVGWATVRIFGVALTVALVLWAASIADERIKKELGDV
jgi:hypothetical protein